MNTDDNKALPPNVTPIRPNRPQAAGGESPMLFWADRDPAIQWRATALLLLVMSPLAFFEPAQFILAALAVAATGWLNAAGFRFYLSATELRVRAAWLAPTLRIPLGEIAEVSTVPDAAGSLMPMAAGSGHLLIRKTDGAQIIVPGIKAVAEAIDAIRTLKRRAQEAEQPDRAAA
jgi:hypothetical protein